MTRQTTAKESDWAGECQIEPCQVGVRLDIKRPPIRLAFQSDQLAFDWPVVSAVNASQPADLTKQKNVFLSGEAVKNNAS